MKELILGGARSGKSGLAERRAIESVLAVDCALLDGELDALIDCLPQLPGHIILVSNEAGQGVVPQGATSRLYADTAGRLPQRAAAVCDCVSRAVRTTVAATQIGAPWPAFTPSRSPPSTARARRWRPTPAAYC